MDAVIDINDIEISLVIPIYNEEGNIEELTQKIVYSVSGLGRQSNWDF